MGSDGALEIGTGSGYAAAVLGRIAEQVYTIERHADLARTARERLIRLGYRNVEVREGDGTLGCPEAALFDAYLWLEETRAVEPLPTTPRTGVPETYPFGL